MLSGQKRTVQQINADIDDEMIWMRDAILQSYKRAFELFWFNSGATAQEICDDRGTKAAKLIQLSGLVRQFMLDAHAIAGAELPVEFSSLIPPKAITINEDGTVLIG